LPSIPLTRDSAVIFGMSYSEVDAQRLCFKVAGPIFA